MDTFLQQVYVSEIKTQCRFALNAIGGANFALKKVHEPTTPERNEHQFFHAEGFRQLHSFLTHASNVSRILWPALPKRDTPTSVDRGARGAVLRGLYGLAEEHQLKNRTLRDHLEHYDERLDEWRRTSTNRNIVSDTIGPRNAISGIAETDMMRWFDPTTNRFRFRGEEYDVQELATAIARLQEQSMKLEAALWEKAATGPDSGDNARKA